MPSTADLVDLLRERSEHPEHNRAMPALPDLHRRISRRRRARLTTAAVAVLALLTVAAVPIVVARSAGSGDRIGGPAVPQADDRAPAEYTFGYRLADSKASPLPAGNTFTYTFTPTSYDFELMLWCDAERGNRLRAFIGEHQVLTDYCEPDGRRQEVAPFSHSEPVAAKQAIWSALGVVPNQPVTVTVRVHAGMDDDPQVATATGTAMLLLYLPVPFADYPFPPRPSKLGELPQVTAEPGEPVINTVDAAQAGPNAYAPLSVVKKPGRDISMTIYGGGPGVARLYANHVLVYTLEFWDWNGFFFTVDVDPDVVAPQVALGAEFTVAVQTDDFTAPLWQLVVRDVPARQPGG